MSLFTNELLTWKEPDGPIEIIKRIRESLKNHQEKGRLKADTILLPGGSEFVRKQLKALEKEFPHLNIKLVEESN